MEFKILGRVTLDIDGARFPLGAAQQRRLLTLLLYHIREPVRLESIAEELWTGRPAENYRKKLHPLASRIRGVLDAAGLDNRLECLPGGRGYRLDIDPALIDFHRFRKMVDKASGMARQQQYDAASAHLVAALLLWADEPVAELRGPRAGQIRRQMNLVWLQAHRLLATSLLNLGRYDLALDRLRQPLATEELDEELAQYWITALCGAGRMDDARRFLVSFRRRFRREWRTASAVYLPGGPQDPRAAPAAPRVPTQLPRDVRDFTGHEQALADLDNLLVPGATGENVVVITGMPGVGKTVLAVHWGHLNRHLFVDGQLYLDLRAHGPMPPMSADDALGRLLRTLDLPADRIPDGEQARRDRLTQLLAGRRVLLILDNAQDSDQVMAVLPAVDSCVTVVTSRQRLRGLTLRYGARVVTVQPLDEPESRSLLTRLIGERRSGAEPEAVRQLARISGGLPLVVRLLGDSVAERPLARVGELVEDLSARLLDAGVEDEEGTSLPTVFDWSYRALTPPAALLFRRLGLFPGASVSPLAAAALVGRPVRDTTMLLDMLARANLIMHGPAQRLVLHDVLHRYSRDLADRVDSADDRESAMRRLLRWYLLTAVKACEVLTPSRRVVPDLPEAVGFEPLGFDSDQDALRWYAQEQDNLLAVTRWAVDHRRYRVGWQIPGQIHEIVERFAWRDDLLEIYQLAVVAARADGHDEGQFGSHANLGTMYFARYDDHRAEENFVAGLEVARRIGNRSGEQLFLNNLASVRLRKGAVADAIDLYREVVEGFHPESEPSVEAFARHRLGDAYRRLGEYETAIEHYRQALVMWRAQNSLRRQGTTYGEMAGLFLEIDLPEVALENCRHALDLHQRAGDSGGLCDTLTTLAEIQGVLRRYDDAIGNARRASELSEELTDSRRRCRALTALATAYAGFGKMTAARRHCAEGLELLAEIAGPKGVGADAELRRLESRLLSLLAD